MDDHSIMDPELPECGIRCVSRKVVGWSIFLRCMLYDSIPIHYDRTN